MIDPDALNVWNEQRLVGYLWRNPVGMISFRYDSDWIARSGFSISQTLLLTTDDFTADHGVAHRFFANLLPEGGVREQIARDLKIPNTDFDLLRAIGGECAGALSILPVEQLPSSEHRYRPITDDELASLANRRSVFYTAWPEDRRPRLSLAGAQNKCPILVRDENYFLPQGDAPSSHILKFELADYRHIPAFETFTTQLAGAIGLPVVDVELRATGKTYYTLVSRYDRLKCESGDMRRLHQEDFCQALGFGHEKKYQSGGGPSFEQCYSLVREVSSEPAMDTINLLRWQIFNVFAGNSDGHAKNLSLLYLPDGPIRLAPFYDLLCTRAIERIDYQLALDVGGERNPNAVAEAHWKKLASDCDIKPQFIIDLVTETAEQLSSNLDDTRANFESKHGDYPALQRIERIIRKQCQRTSK